MTTLTAITDNIDTEDWADIINVYVSQQNAILQHLVAGDIVAGPIALTLVSSWVDFAAGQMGAMCFKGPDKMIYTFGVIKDGTATAGTTLFTYPSGYRPSAALRFTTVSNSAFAWGQIGATGVTTIQSGSNTWFSLFIPPFRAV